VWRASYCSGGLRPTTVHVRLKVGGHRPPLQPDYTLMCVQRASKIHSERALDCSHP
jgi:hypothetical protein